MICMVNGFAILEMEDVYLEATDGSEVHLTNWNTVEITSSLLEARNWISGQLLIDPNGVYQIAEVLCSDLSILN